MLAALLGLVALLAAAAPFLGRWAGRPGGWPLAAGLLALALWVGLAPPALGTSWFLPWIPSLDVGIRLRFDGLSWVFLLLVLGVGAAVLAYSARYLKRGPHPGFYGLMTAFAAAMTGLVLADDVILLFVMWEFTTVCSFFLIARTSPQAQAPAVRTFLVTVGGGLCLLGAVIATSVRTGTTQLSAILEDPVWSQDPTFAAVIAVLVAVAAFTKSAQFPFHAWLPDAMVAPTPVSAYLHAAAMVKAGIYLLLRFSPAMSDVLTWNVLLITIGLVTTVMGAVFALQRNDLKELLAYSTVSQLGLIVATIGVGSS
ncbi:proton-conducting transporter membrane subunit, partial [Isoptericola halotolerans]